MGQPLPWAPVLCQGHTAAPGQVVVMGVSLFSCGCCCVATALLRKCSSGASVFLGTKYTWEGLLLSSSSSLSCLYYCYQHRHPPSFPGASSEMFCALCFCRCKTFSAPCLGQDSVKSVVSNRASGSSSFTTCPQCYVTLQTQVS